jgi:hypothetical protein
VTAALRHEWPRPERDRKIKPCCVSGLTDGLGRPRLGGEAQRSGARPRPAERGVQAFGCPPRCCRLRGVLLCLAQLADRPGQPDEARRQVKRGRRGAGLAAACHREEPGGGAEPVSLGGPGRDLPVGGPRGPVERIGGPAQRRITDRPGGGMERGGRRPGRIGGRSGVSPTAAPDLLRRCFRLPGRVPVKRVPFRRGEPERAGS